jgi:uncharacterized protein DUF2637
MTALRRTGRPPDSAAGQGRRRENRPPRTAPEQARRLRLWARLVLIPVALIGAALSFRGLYAGAKPTFGTYLALGFPALVDLLILGSCLAYVAGAKVGRAMPGWKRTAYLGVAGTLLLNALAATHWADVPWHITAPAVWAALVELTAAQVLGDYDATQPARAGRIGLTLWITAPRESLRTRLLMIRTGIRDTIDARTALGVHAASRQALLLALPGRDARKTRRIINQLIHQGSLDPTAIMAPLGWGQTASGNAQSPEAFLRDILTRVLAPPATPTPTALPAGASAESEGPGLATDLVANTWEPPGPERLDRGASRATSQPNTNVPALEHTGSPGANLASLQTENNPEDRGDQSMAISPVYDDLPLTEVPELPEVPESAEPVEPNVEGGTTAAGRITDGPEPGEEPDQAPDEPAGRGPAGQEPGSEYDAIDSVQEIHDQAQPAAASSRRLNDAIEIATRNPDISGSGMAKELRQRGWSVSVRTGTRILRAARQETARQEATATPKPTLSAVP